MKLTQQEENYLLAEKSDPFARARLITHKRNGIAKPYFNADNDRVDATYGADLATETRRLPPSDEFPDGQEYDVTVARNRHRP